MEPSSSLPCYQNVPSQFLTDVDLLTLATNLNGAAVCIIAVTSDLLEKTTDYGERGISVVLRNEPKLTFFYAVSTGFTRLLPCKLEQDEGIPNAQELFAAFDRAMIRAGFHHCQNR